MNTRDLNTFDLWAVVNIGLITEYQDVTITRISDSGVTISGPRCGKDIVLSGKSPATFVRQSNAPTVTSVIASKSLDPVAARVEAGAVQINGSPFTNLKDNNVESTSNRVARGTYTEKMKSLIMPDSVKPFTIQDFADLNAIPVNYALGWVKSHCLEVGFKDKLVGQRGKAAKLYKVGID